MASNPLKVALKKASHAAVRNAVIKLRPHITGNRWIGSNNIYAKNYKINPSEEVLTRRATLNRKQIKDYIAASIFTHCADGWSLLGRALNAAARGDGSSSVHLAYYAELRAAMSLLACEGIGVFNYRHAVISDSTVGLTPESSPHTHRFTWLALEHWTDRKLSSQALAEIIAPGAITLSDWFDAFNIASNLHPIGQSWLRAWGIDIKQFSDDRILRNYSSYRPSRIVTKNNISAEESTSFVKELWHLCEPNPTSRFDEIDRHLLRMSLARAYQAIHGVNPQTAANIVAYRAWVDTKIPNVGLTPALSGSWRDFLTWNTSPGESSLIHEAGQLSSVDDPKHHLQVLARATLLLRIATGLNAKILKHAHFTKADLEFWWRPYITDHGVISNGGIIPDFTDLWDDAEIALQDISNWETGTARPYSYWDLATNVSSQLSKLGECERIALWGLEI